MENEVNPEYSRNFTIIVVLFVLLVIVGVIYQGPQNGYPVYVMHPYGYGYGGYGYGYPGIPFGYGSGYGSSGYAPYAYGMPMGGGGYYNNGFSQLNGANYWW